MSLAIDVDSVLEVLLPDGQWHQVANGSFEIDAYEYLRASEFEVGGGDKGIRFKGGQEEQLVPAAGARWLERNSQGNVRTVFCPITAIKAVATGWSADKKSNWDTTRNPKGLTANLTAKTRLSPFHEPDEVTRSDSHSPTTYPELSWTIGRNRGYCPTNRPRNAGLFR